MIRRNQPKIASKNAPAKMQQVRLRITKTVLIFGIVGVFLLYSVILFHSFQPAPEAVSRILPSDGTVKLDRRLPRVLAIFFPQFHRDPLNDKLWGEGFTDWNNVRAAPRQNRLGFDIPRPTELGYYDLASTDTRRMQGKLAREYGIDGFVYHHYWFYDETHPGPNLHRPLVEMLKDGHPDLPFFLNWCNINWANTWSGKAINSSHADGSVLLQGQTFPDPDHPSVQEHYDWLKQFFHHPNYIKVDGQPVFMLHQKKPRAFPILKRFRELAQQDGFPSLYIIVGMSKTHDELFPEGKDEGQRFNRFPANMVNRTVAYPQPYEITSKKVLTVPEWCLKEEAPHKSGFQIPGIMSSFDNTPRRDFETAFLWSADEPDKVVQRFHESVYAAVYYETCCVSSEERKVDGQSVIVGGADGDKRLIMINAMNEWAEGMALEPSTVFGRRFLEAISDDVKAKVLKSGCAR